MKLDGAKRFYKRAETTPLDDAYGVALDGRAVRTPAGGELRVPNQSLADAVCAEWQVQGEKIEPNTMPLMQLACTAIDRVMPNRAAIITEIAGYAGSDLLCYRSEGPDELVERQAQTWQPLLDWSQATFAAPLETATGIIHVTQPAKSLEAFHDVLAALDDWQLTATAQMTQIMGSLVLALAVTHHHLEWEDAFKASVLDELFQAERWGEDREALQRQAMAKQEVRWATTFHQLLETFKPH
jgi:chaperone required for assembly of F1-ATPase